MAVCRYGGYGYCVLGRGEDGWAVTQYGFFLACSSYLPDLSSESVLVDNGRRVSLEASRMVEHYSMTAI